MEKSLEEKINDNTNDLKLQESNKLNENKIKQLDIKQTGISFFFLIFIFEKCQNMSKLKINLIH